jgi:hypothetical protein
LARLCRRVVPSHDCDLIAYVRDPALH